MQENNQKKGVLQLKVLVGFTIALLAVTIAALITFNSLNRLIASVRTISAPDEKLIYLKQLLTDLSNEENNVKTYAVTQEQKYLDNYHQLSDSIHHKISKLQSLAGGDSMQSATTDSISLYVTQREELFDYFLGNRESEFPAKPFARSSSKLKSISNAAREETAAAEAAARSDSLNEAKKTTGIFNKVKNVFSSPGKKNQNKGVQPPDTMKAKPQAQAISTEEINHIISLDRAELNKQVKEWSTSEFILLQQDKIAMDKIRSQIHLLEEKEEAIVQLRVAEANLSANQARIIITVITLLGIISILVFIYLILADIAKSNRLKAQLIESRKKAEALARVKEEFLANMSHEIRTPLNSIVGFTEQLSKQNENSRHAPFIRAIQNSSDHLVSIVNQILDFSKLEAGKFTKENLTFNIHQLFSEVIDSLKIKAAEKSILLTCDILEDVPACVEGDPVSVKQILINLVSNGIKFTEYGKVNVYCSVAHRDKEKADIKIEVKDTGIGISPKMQEKIFEEFTQGENDISRKYGGTGLGLTITKKLVELLHGKLQVSSEEGKGSVFTVTLPFNISETTKLGKEPAALDASLLRNKWVLLVDDEEMNVLLGETILKNWGIKTDVARSGKETIEKIRQKDYDVILLDIQMPGMGGLEVAKIIRSSLDQQKKQTPIIALTANVFSKEAAGFSESGFNAVLVKPFKEQELFEKIKSLVSADGQSALVENSDHGSSNNGYESTSPHELFSLKYLKNVSGSNVEFEITMLESFVRNNTSHVSSLRKALAAEDWESIYLLVHKMIPQFRYLEIRGTGQKLKLIEEWTGEKKQLEKVPALLEEIIVTSERAMESIQKEIKKLQHVSGLIPESIKTELVTNHHQ